MPFTSDRIPKPTDLCTVCDRDVRKRAALLFDRIWVPTEGEGAKGGPDGIRIVVEHKKEDEKDDIPVDLTFDISEISSVVGSLWLHAMFPERLEPGQPPPTKEQAWQSLIRRLNVYHQVLCKAFTDCGFHTVPMFASEESFRDNFPSGDAMLLQGACNNLPVVTEDVSWDHIMEFRRDPEALRKYRSFRMWLSEGLKAKTVSQATDLIAKKIEDYEWSIRKYGLNCVKGTLSFFLDWKHLAPLVTVAAAGDVLGGPAISALGAGVTLAAEIAIKAIEWRVELEDIKRGPNSEVAILSEIEKKFGRS